MRRTGPNQPDETFDGRPMAHIRAPEQRQARLHGCCTGHRARRPARPARPPDSRRGESITQSCAASSANCNDALAVTTSHPTSLGTRPVSTDSIAEHRTIDAATKRTAHRTRPFPGNVRGNPWRAFHRTTPAAIRARGSRLAPDLSSWLGRHAAKRTQIRVIPAIIVGSRCIGLTSRDRHRVQDERPA